MIWDVAFEKHLLIDGSNVLRAWPELRALERRDRDAARNRLSDTVRILHDFEEFRLTLVFDGKGQEVVVEHPSGHETFTVVFTPSHLTGDDVIEHLVGQSTDPRTCWVATDDRAERQTVDAVGGSSLSAAELAEWVDRARVRQSAQLSGLHERNRQEWRRK
ncbi:RNA-binding protein [Opitutaceae bacterium EW11]|nr:RNA-binding protein [Opitutaceae bacterium EW11]